jgi:hypothetical protein
VTDVATARDSTPRTSTLGVWRNVLRALAVAMGAVHTTVAVLQQSMNEDGINYLDMGDAYLRGDWGAAINGVWSPVYGVLIAAAVRIVKPAIAWEFPTVQLVNFGIYVVALVCFEFFWRRLTSRYFAASGAGEDAVRFPPALWLALGYSLFIWSSLNLIRIWAVTPDMGVAADVYVAAGLMLQAPDRPANARAAVALGLLLGFGYLVKAALLPLGVVALVLAAAAATGGLRRRGAGLLVSLAGMLLIAGPLIGALSWSAGHLTIGDVGRFTYLKHVNEMPYPDFHGAATRLPGAPLHPPRRVFDDPPVYEFAEPIAGTYPMAFNPGYWTAGIEPRVSVEGQLRALLTNAIALFDLFVRAQGGFVAIVALLWLLGRRAGIGSVRVSGETALILWALAAFGMYSLVHVLPRYIAPFVVLAWAGILAGLRFPADDTGKRLASLGAVLLTLFVWVNLAASNLEGLGAVTGFRPLAEGASQPSAEIEHRAAAQTEIADALLQIGIRRGDEIAFIGYSYTEYWARLARLKIIAEIHSHDAGRFWNATADRQAGAIAAFARTGAAAVIAEPVAHEPPPGWQPVGDTGYLIYRLR